MMASDGSTSSTNGGGAAACAVCGGAAAVYCAADAAALCVPCDAAVHAANPLASRHDRVPLAAAVAAMASSGVYDHLFAASDDDAAASPWAATQASPNNNDSSSSFTTSDGAVAAGERSLFDLLSDVDIMSCGGGVAGVFDGASTHTISPPMWLHPGHLAAALTAWSPVDSAAAVVVPTNNASASAMAREERVRRYREKRKNRKFQKTIRYASRKAYAEARPRIKGRFVKRPAAAGAAASDDDSSATAAGVAPEEAKFWLSFSGDDARADGGVGFYMDNAAAAYGVVPTF